MSVIHAYTEPNCTLPAYVNLAERDPGLFILTVRSSGAQDSQAIPLTRTQLLDLVNNAAEYLDSELTNQHPDQAEKNKAIVASIAHETMRFRIHILEMALRTPGANDHHGVLKAAKAYQDHIKGDVG